MHRPFSVTITAWLVLMLTAWNALRAWTALDWQAVLVEFSAGIPPVASAAIGIAWATIGLTLWLGIRGEKAWAGRWLPWAAAGYTVWFWCERVFLQFERQNTWFAVIINIVLFIPIYLSHKSISREAYERANKIPETE